MRLQPNPKLEAAVRAASAPIPHSMNADDELELRLRRHLAEQGLERRTIRIYAAQLRRWCDWSRPDNDPCDLDPNRLIEWAQTVPHSHASRSHARSTIKHLSAMLGTAGAPWEAIRLPRPARRKSRAVSHQQARDLLLTARRIGGREGLSVLIGLYTAARRVEIAGMRWDRIDWDEQMLTFWRPKNRDWHTVPMHPTLVEELQRRRPSDPTVDPWIFPGLNGGHITPARIGTWVKLIAEKAGVPRVTTHVLRHTALTEANEATGDLLAVKELAGHIKPETTALYVRVSEDRKRKAVDALDWGD